MRRLSLCVGGLVALCAARAMAGCVGDSSIADSGIDSSTDTGVDVTTTTDSGKDTSSSDAPLETGPKCDLDAAFALPVELSSLNVQLDAGAAVRGVHLSNDLLIAYYQYGSGTLYSASRPTPTGDTFTSPQLLSSLEVADASVAQGYPSVTTDGKTVYFASSRNGLSQIFFATRANPTDAFGAPAPVTGLPPTFSAASPFVQGDGTTLYFSMSTLDAGVSYDTYRAPITGQGALGTPVAVTELNTAGSDGPVGVTADGLTIYFSRISSADGGIPGPHYKIWKATRATTSDPFSNLTIVTEVNSTDGYNDDMCWVSNDGCWITISSFRAGGSNVFLSGK